MKKCEYCAKEISYHEMYCCENCEKKATEYFTKRTKFQKLISICNIIGTCLIGIGIFVFAMQNFAGALMVAAGGFFVGLITYFLPCPTDNMISKNKLDKAIRTVRIFGIILLLFACAALVFAFFKM